ncbi:hypothetical protein S21ZY_106 [Pseudomonas phage ZY21]|nr:hypothetical protein S21ZY_106 [Pseudomonas phage ZY21]
MKTFAKEMWHFLVFAAALIAFNTGLSVLFDTYVEYWAGDLTLKSALFLTAVQVALGMMALKTFEWLHAFIAETRGMKYFKEAIEKHGKELRDVQKKLEDKVIEFANANESLKASNDELHDALVRSNETIELMLAQRSPAPEPVNQHLDDWALDQFVIQLRAKLRKKREEGRAGWNDCQLAVLHDLLVEEVESLNAENMDMVDVANYAMFCWVRDAFPNECMIGYDPDAADAESFVDEGPDSELDEMK